MCVTQRRPAGPLCIICIMHGTYTIACIYKSTELKTATRQKTAELSRLLQDKYFNLAGYI